MELFTSVLASSLFATVISYGPGKEMTESPTGRVLLGAIGFAIPLAGYAAKQKDRGLFLMLAGWFIACCAPVWIGGQVSDLIQRHGERTERDEARLTNALNRRTPRPAKPGNVQP